MIFSVYCEKQYTNKFDLIRSFACEFNYTETNDHILYTAHYYKLSLTKFFNLSTYCYYSKTRVSS